MTVEAIKQHYNQELDRVLKVWSEQKGLTRRQIESQGYVPLEDVELFDFYIITTLINGDSTLDLKTKIAIMELYKVGGIMIRRINQKVRTKSLDYEEWAFIDILKSVGHTKILEYLYSEKEFEYLINFEY